MYIILFIKYNYLHILGEIKRQIEHLKQSVHDQYQLLTDPTIPSIHIACLEEINEATPTLSTGLSPYINTAISFMSLYCL